MLQERIYHYRLNGEDRTCRWLPVQVSVNGKPGQLQDFIEFGDRIEYRLNSVQPRLRDIPESQELCNLKVTVNQQPVELSCGEPRIVMNGQEVELDALLIDGAELQVDAAIQHTQRYIPAIEFSQC